MRTRSWARRPVMLASALALAAFLPACGGGGGGGGNTPTTLPPAPQPTRTQIAGGNFTLAGADEANRQGFVADVGTTGVSVSGTGTVEIVADWTFTSNDVDILFYNGSCSAAQAIRNQCPIANRTTSTTTKPERLTITGVPAGNYTVGFANYGRTSESGNYQVFLTR